MNTPQNTKTNKIKKTLIDDSFKIIFEHSPVSTQIFALNGDLIEVNKAWEMLWGTTHDILGHYNILNDEQLINEGIMPYVKKAFKGQVVELPQSRINKKSYKTKWAKGLMYPLKDNKSNILGIVLQHEDLTKQMVAQQKVIEHANYAKFIGEVGIILSRSKILPDMLNECAEALVTYFNGSFARIWILNTKTQILELEASAGMYTHLNGEHSRILIGKFKIGNIALSKLPYLTNDILHDEAVNNKWATENKMKAFAGYPLMVGDQVVGVMGMFSKNKLTNIALNAMEAVANDIALSIQHKRFEERLKESEESFRAMADNIPNLAWMANPDGWIFWYNNRWYEYTGTKPKDMEGWGWQSVHSPESLPIVMKEWTKSINEGKPFEMVFPIRGNDAIFRPFLTRVAPVKNEAGEITRWFGTNTDITRQKELERQKDEFIGIASHELKTPVTSIKIFTQVMQKRFIKKGDDDSALLLSKMDTQINKLTHLIEDLLDVTKIESGKLRFNESLYDFNELASEIIEEAQRITPIHQIIKQGESSKLIFGDRERIGQVLLNFLTNAIKYSHSGDKIIISVQNSAKYLTVSVQDFGIGIPKSKQPHVFERFYRETGPKEDTYPGLGLGLYISKEIIARQGGSVGLISEIDQGSTFHFKLPVGKIVT